VSGKHARDITRHDNRESTGAQYVMTRHRQGLEGRMRSHTGAGLPAAIEQLSPPRQLQFVGNRDGHAAYGGSRAKRYASH
jgi:hypothetical protein